MKKEQVQLKFPKMGMREKLENIGRRAAAPAYAVPVDNSGVARIYNYCGPLSKKIFSHYKFNMSVHKYKTQLKKGHTELIK
jgi:hypothetical protein